MTKGVASIERRITVFGSGRTRPFDHEHVKPSQVGLQDITLDLNLSTSISFIAFVSRQMRVHTRNAIIRDTEGGKTRKQIERAGEGICSRMASSNLGAEIKTGIYFWRVAVEPGVKRQRESGANSLRCTVARW